jgi:hypothetical protein
MTEFEFDPDDVDLTGDPEYQARLQAGPVAKTQWAPPGEASRAKRRQMYLIDAEMSAKWLTVMEKLLEADLDDAEFTTQRMFLLRLWTKERKRRQHNLHYQFDPSRRRPGLVERDSKKVLADFAKLKERLDEGIARMEARYPSPADPPSDDAGSVDLGRGQRAKPLVPRRVVLGEKPEHLDEGTFKMIVDDTSITDPVNATDEKILQAYEAKGQGGYTAEFYLALLRGHELPERPEELG